MHSFSVKSQSTIKMEKGYYLNGTATDNAAQYVAIHNKNGKGLLPYVNLLILTNLSLSQSTIKMEKGYYL